MEKRLISQIESKMPFAAKVHLNSDLFDELGFDSGLLLDLIVSLEEDFNCQFSERELSVVSLRTPGRILELIRAHQNRYQE